MRLILSQVGLPDFPSRPEIVMEFTGYAVVRTANSARAGGGKDIDVVRDA